MFRYITMLLITKHLNMTLKLTDLQKRSFCYCKRSGLLLLSFCIIIVLTQQAVALSLSAPSISSSELSLTASPLEMISPQVINSALASVFVPVTTATNVLTPGQRVIKSVPVKDRGNFIFYQLAIGLKATDTAQAQPRWLSNLADYIQYFEQTMTELKILQNVPVYGNFSADLLQWLMEQLNLTHQDVYMNLNSRSQVLCTAEGVCYSSAAMGAYCCPF